MTDVRLPARRRGRWELHAAGGGGGARAGRGEGKPVRPSRIIRSCELGEPGLKRVVAGLVAVLVTEGGTEGGTFCGRRGCGIVCLRVTLKACYPVV